MDPCKTEEPKDIGKTEEYADRPASGARSETGPAAGTPASIPARASAAPCGEIEVEIAVPYKVRVVLDENNVFDWITECRDPAALDRLSAYARKCAAQIRSGAEPDDFRSRA